MANTMRERTGAPWVAGLWATPHRRGVARHIVGRDGRTARRRGVSLKIRPRSPAIKRPWKGHLGSLRGHFSLKAENQCLGELPLDCVNDWEAARATTPIPPRTARAGGSLDPA